MTTNSYQFIHQFIKNISYIFWCFKPHIPSSNQTKWLTGKSPIFTHGGFCHGKKSSHGGFSSHVTDNKRGVTQGNHQKNDVKLMFLKKNTRGSPSWDLKYQLGFYLKKKSTQLFEFYQRDHQKSLHSEIIHPTAWWPPFFCLRKNTQQYGNV